jgi:hypothetical protein
LAKKAKKMVIVVGVIYCQLKNKTNAFKLAKQESKRKETVLEINHHKMSLERDHKNRRIFQIILNSKDFKKNLAKEEKVT